MTHVGAWVMCPDKSSLFRSRQYLRLRCLPHCMHNWRLQHLKSCPRNYFKRQYVMGQRCRMRCYNAIYDTMQQAATVAILQSTIANVSQQQLCEMGSHINVCRRCYNGILHAMRQWSIVCDNVVATNKRKCATVIIGCNQQRGMVCDNGVLRGMPVLRVTTPEPTQR